MKLLRGILGMLLACLSLALIGPMQSASASSSFDNLRIASSGAPSDVSSSHGCNTDLTATLFSQFRHQMGVTNYDNFMDEIIASESRAMAFQTVYYSSDVYVMYMWSTATTSNFDFSLTNQGNNYEPSFYYNSGSGGVIKFIYAPVYSDCTIGSFNISSSTQYQLATPASNYFARYHVVYASGKPVSYPDGYEGGSVPDSHTTPTTPYTGTVDCGGEEPLLMSIYQAGNNGAATLTPESLGRADWSYSLNGNPYSITVDCGGTLAGSNGTVLPTTGTDWVCDPYGDDLHYCVLG